MIRRNAVLACLVAVLTVTAAWGQKRERQDPNTRSVQGVVRDAADNPVEGAVVQLKNVKTLQVRSFITQQDGTYHFHGLNTNVDYELRAEYKGSASDVKTLSTFDGRAKPVINLKLEARKS